MNASDENEFERRLSAARAVGALEMPSMAARTRARSLFTLLYPASESAVIRIARLVLDTLRGPATLTPARGATVSEVRELHFAVDETTVRLVAEPDGAQGWYVIGQMVGADDAPVAGVVGTLGAVVGQSVGRGEMHFEGIVAGVYRARLTLPGGGVIVLPEVPVGVV
jgi:hypothetical protein